jgi:hypothetical protein
MSLRCLWILSLSRPITEFYYRQRRIIVKLPLWNHSGAVGIRPGLAPRPGGLVSKGPTPQKRGSGGEAGPDRSYQLPPNSTPFAKGAKPTYKNKCALSRFANVRGAFWEGVRIFFSVLRARSVRTHVSRSAPHIQLCVARVSPRSQLLRPQRDPAAAMWPGEGWGVGRSSSRPQCHSVALRPEIWLRPGRGLTPWERDPSRFSNF